MNTNRDDRVRRRMAARNRILVRALHDGTILPAVTMLESNFPPRPTIKKAEKLLEFKHRFRPNLRAIPDES